MVLAEPLLLLCHIRPPTGPPSRTIVVHALPCLRISLLEWLRTKPFFSRENEAVTLIQVLTCSLRCVGYPIAGGTEHCLGQTSKTRRKSDWKTCEIDGSHLCLQQFDKYVEVQATAGNGSYKKSMLRLVCKNSLNHCEHYFRWVFSHLKSLCRAEEASLNEVGCFARRKGSFRPTKWERLR